VVVVEVEYIKNLNHIQMENNNSNLATKILDDAYNTFRRDMEFIIEIDKEPNPNKIALLTFMGNIYSLYQHLLVNQFLNKKQIYSIYNRIVDEVIYIEDIHEIFESELFIDLVLHFVIISDIFQKELEEVEQYEIISNVTSFRSLYEDFLVDRYFIVPKSLIN
jgi:hypothetical protein